MFLCALKYSNKALVAVLAAGLTLAGATAVNADGLGLGIGIGLGGANSGESGSGGGLGIGGGVGVGANDNGGLGIGAGLGVGNRSGGIATGAAIGLGGRQSDATVDAGIVTSGALDSQTTGSVNVGKLNPGDVNARIDVDTSLAGQVQGDIGTGLDLGPVGAILDIGLNQGTGDPSGPDDDGADDPAVADMISALSATELQNLIRRCDRMLANPGLYTKTQLTICQMAM